MNYFEIVMGLVRSGKTIFDTIQKMREHAKQTAPLTPGEEAQLDVEIAELRDYVKHPEYRPD